MVRVRVKAINFYRVESGPPKKPGRSATRRARRIPQGAEITVSREYYEAHKGSLRLLGKDTGKAVTEPSDLDALRAEAAELGIEVDKRWREGRLNDEIAKARAELEDEDADEDPNADEDAGDAE